MKLIEQFPNLRFAGPASAFIEKSRRDDIDGQLAERRILKVEICPLLMSTAGLEVEHEGFRIKIEDTLTHQEQAEELGHEIAHTFHYNLTMSPPQCLIPSQNELGTEQLHELEEFCWVFSALWVEKNGIETLVEFVAKQEDFAINHGAGPED